MKNSYNNINDNCSLFIMSCDNYSDVWNFLFDGIKEYWSYCPYQIYLCTETKKYTRNDMCINTININNKNWGYRLKEGLKYVPTDYVFLLLDDLFPGKKVDQDKLNRCLSLLKQNDSVSCIYVSSTGDDKNDRVYKKEINYTEWPIEFRSNYRLNATPGFWKKESLIKFTKETDNAWSWEVFGTLRIHKYKDRILTVEDENTIFPYEVICPSGAIVKGKWNSLYVKNVKGKYTNNVFEKRGVSKIDEANCSLTIKDKLNFIYDGFKACGFLVVFYLFDYLITNDKK